jgi:hypothetical protein
VSKRMRQLARQARSEGNDQHARVAERAAEQASALRDMSYTPIEGATWLS